MRGAPPASSTPSTSRKQKAPGSDAGVTAPASPPASPTSSTGDAILMSVSALATLIGDALQRVPKSLRVVGEVSGFRERTHWYFDLKDSEAVVNCVMFASAARKAGFMLENGRSVVATGRVDFYAKGGKVSFLCEKIEHVGAGPLELRFRRLVAEIRALGWFDPARKRPLPTFARRIAVITSRTGAALQDVLDTARRRCPAVDILIIDVRVQGDRAASEVAAAIEWLGREHGTWGVDALLVTRGGGSAEDLWAFNEKIVAQAIVNCPIPVVAAIGHETDTSIAELVADERAATPTQAVMRLIPDAASLLEQVEALDSRLRTLVDRTISGQRRRTEDALRHLASSLRLTLAHARSRLERLASRLEQNRPAAAQARREARLHAAERRLSAAIAARMARMNLPALETNLRDAATRNLRRSREAATALERTLSAVSPLRVLARGYSVTTRADGRVIRAPGEVSPGELIQTRVSDGHFGSTVEGEAPTRVRPAGAASPPDEPATPTAPGPAPSRDRWSPPNKRARTSQDQLGLFGAEA